MPTLIRLAAATVLVATAGLTWAPSAGAAACTSDSGVTVVVDFNQLRGDDLERACVADQGTADDLFRVAGHSLENVSGQAFVCRVDGLPGTDTESCTRTPPQNAYWGLWWSDGTDGTWTYSSQGAYALDVPDGGAVAFSWNGTTTSQRPSVAPPRHDEPTQEPDHPRGGDGNGGSEGTGGDPGGGSTSGTPTTEPTASPTSSAAPGDGSGRQRGDREGLGDRDRDRDGGTRDRDGKNDGDADPTDEPTDEPTASADDTVTASEPPASTSDDGLPVWVGPTAVGGVLGAAGLAAYLRRRAA